MTDTISDLITERDSVLALTGAAALVSMLAISKKQKSVGSFVMAQAGNDKPQALFGNQESMENLMKQGKPGIDRAVQVFQGQLFLEGKVTQALLIEGTSFILPSIGIRMGITYRPKGLLRKFAIGPVRMLHDDGDISEVCDRDWKSFVRGTKDESAPSFWESATVECL